jgi:hypothetical protein
MPQQFSSEKTTHFFFSNKYEYFPFGFSLQQPKNSTIDKLLGNKKKNPKIYNPKILQ